MEILQNNEIINFNCTFAFRTTNLLISVITDFYAAT